VLRVLLRDPARVLRDVLLELPPLREPALLRDPVRVLRDVVPVLPPDDRRDVLRFGGGTFAPFSRASESPIAMACSRLFTRPPRPFGPLFNVPRLRRRIALSTDLDAASPYLRPPELDLLRVGIVYLLCECAIRSRPRGSLPCSELSSGRRWIGERKRLDRPRG